MGIEQKEESYSREQHVSRELGRSTDRNPPLWSLVRSKRRSTNLVIGLSGYNSNVAVFALSSLPSSSATSNIRTFIRPHRVPIENVSTISRTSVWSMWLLLIWKKQLLGDTLFWSDKLNERLLTRANNIAMYKDAYKRNKRVGAEVAYINWLWKRNEFVTVYTSIWEVKRVTNRVC